MALSDGDCRMKLAGAVCSPARIQGLWAERSAGRGPRRQVRHIVSGVTASLAFIDAAIAAGADALLVHHGLFWRGQDGRLTGWLGTRACKRLMAAKREPVRLPPAAGRACRTGQQRAVGRCGSSSRADGAFWRAGSWASSVPAAAGRCRRGRAVQPGRAGSRNVQQALARPTAGAARRRPAVAPRGLVHRRRTGLLRGRHCTAGADAFLTGEISEPQAHHRTRDRRCLPGLRPPRHRALTAPRRWRLTWPPCNWACQPPVHRG